MKKLNTLINEHLESKNIYEENPRWIIRNSDIGGRGLFANCDIKVGDVIFKDNPLIIGPRSSMLCPVVCIICYKQIDLNLCSRNCGLYVCSRDCENSLVHQQECDLINNWKTENEKTCIDSAMTKCLTPVRSLLLSDNQKELLKLLISHSGLQHGFEIDILKNKLKLDFNSDEEDLMRLTCTVLDANSFEVTVGNEHGRSGLRGLYPLSSLMNHSCVPNTMHNFDCNQNMIVKATTFIPKGNELFHSYTRFLWGTPVRRAHLARTKHFICRCARCEDPLEYGSNLSAILCENCKCVILPVYTSKMNILWKCNECKHVVTNKKVTVMLRVLGSRLNSFNTADIDVNEILEFVNNKLINYLPRINQMSVELKYKLVWILGYDPKYLWNDLSTDLLNEKEKICRELLNLLETLRAGRSKMRGLLLYELQCCLREKQRRKSDKLEMKTLVQEAQEILKDDVHAPPEFKSCNG
ncbi:hypothetical protein RN001_008240 [Aquatica leii]|uniref:SET domain-containing protein n=1 Tax=Aquatica leii TaxID=1421715 RepID=A0AAN7SH68_9COLE|nr:hypothetical protein RN001_008240 [Aquatica leii]